MKLSRRRRACEEFERNLTGKRRGETGSKEITKVHSKYKFKRHAPATK